MQGSRGNAGKKGMGWNEEVEKMGVRDGSVYIVRARAPARPRACVRACVRAPARVRACKIVMNIRQILPCLQSFYFFTSSHLFLLS